MKNVFLPILCLLMCQLVNAQTAPDFEVTDTHGNVHKLYEDYLDQGKTVMIDLFFVDCPPCNQIAPFMPALYEKYCEGDKDVEFFSITIQGGDDNAKVEGYAEQHGHTFPAISIEGGALEAAQPYTSGEFGNFLGAPTFVVISPDRSMEYDIWDQPDQSTIDLLDVAIAATGASLDCATSSTTNVAHLLSEFSLRPNPATTMTTIDVNLATKADFQIDIVNLVGQVVQTTVSGTRVAGLHQIPLNVSNLPTGTYFVKASIDGTVAQTRKLMKLN